MAAMCDQDDVSPPVGWLDLEQGWQPDATPVQELVWLAA